ncbi:DUF4159 domain-containing protein [Pseudohoeflea coraliihabitans]|uniref:DUF4159 domain-containing protein n=1 Tax=Pseudohoeflea coraliihabitans TaxID=2860393 RepID=A0ABS6WJK5_9HYPH|nr:DUF4159 domain-containing protein [Pseudohoeflea sp. DP4N28-3]MBW3096128.1 DUF4159 domain-containing protein [Pseudohoeflea sp. DP4N28-3]
MSALPLAFGAPLLLFGLLALPVIWWLLRMTPPRPQREAFAPLPILARVLKADHTPAHSPWWLTALRLLVAALIIFALAEPILNPRSQTLSRTGPLVLMIDNGWAAAPDWSERVESAEALLAEAREAELPVLIAFTAERRHEPTPTTAEAALEQLRAAEPRSWQPARASAVDAIITALADTAPGTIAILSDGVAEGQSAAADEQTTAPDDDAAAFERLFALGASDIQIFARTGSAPVALTAASNAANGFEVTAARLPEAGARDITLIARDNRGRDVARGALTFAAGEMTASGRLDAPFELRNDIARLEVVAARTAAGVRLIDDSARRRRVALISGAPADQSQPLLAPLYYIDNALSPFAELRRADSADLAIAVPKLLATNPNVIIMADIGVPQTIGAPSELSPSASADTSAWPAALSEWVRRGGTLIRFAGPRLAAASGDDPLIPVRLRRGERELGGALSWDEPQPLAAYPTAGPFSGLPTPGNVTVKRQVLAEPSADLAARTWASLADGTPLVTAAPRGDGRIVLFHVTAEAGWSNLPISGHFVEMLRRIVQLSNVSRATIEAQDASASTSSDSAAGQALLPPWRLLDASGRLVPANGDARPLDLSAARPQPGPDSPPGLYGNEDGHVALNLFAPGESLRSLVIPAPAAPLTRLPIGSSETIPLTPWLFAAALFGLIADTLIVLILAGGLSRLRSRAGLLQRSRVALALLAALAVSLVPALQPASAQQNAGAPAAASDARAGDAHILEQLDTTHLAYVLTGDDTVDATSRAGLDGLSTYLANRTALEPGAAVGVDIERDELAFYPLIYWPMSEQAPFPTEAAISRIDAYMRSGGSVLFDTRDRIDSLGAGTTGPTRRLQIILSGLDIPALEPVPSDHVLTKAFYLLDTFPGRYADGPLWVEAIGEGGPDGDRPARGGDGVSSILITGNDLAAAWAQDAAGNPLFATVPNDPWQREYAYRAGVNIVMYMLTGNYKADQVHIPALLERLGQ